MRTLFLYFNLFIIPVYSNRKNNTERIGIVRPSFSNLLSLNLLDSRHGNILSFYSVPIYVRRQAGSHKKYQGGSGH